MNFVKNSSIMFSYNFLLFSCSMKGLETINEGSSENFLIKEKNCDYVNKANL